MSLDILHTAWRRLLGRPLQSALALGILALGLAALLFLFGAVNSFVLRPLPYPDAQRLVALGWLKPAKDQEVRTLKAREWLPIRAALDGLGGFDGLAVDGGSATVNLRGADAVRRYQGALIDAGVLPLLGVQPLLGRVFTTDDDRPGAPLAVLMAESVWRNDFGADPGLLGRSVIANGEAATVIGVLPADFRFPGQHEVWLPLRFAGSGGPDLMVTARLAPGASFDQTQAALAALGERLAPEFGGIDEGEALGIQPLHHRFVGDVTRRMVWMMAAAGVLVLLLACANVANLQLARVLDRRRELAVRSALGAGRRRLLGELLAESLILALAASAIAVTLNHFLGLWLLDYMVANENAPPASVRWEQDWRDLLAVPLAALATTLLAGLAPALRAAGTDIQDTLRDGDKGSQGGAFMRMARGLLVFEVAITVVLLVGAAMFVRSIHGMGQKDFGGSTDPATVLTARVGQPAGGAAQDPDPMRYFDRLRSRLEDDPQVRAVTLGTGLPGFAGNDDDEVVEEGRPRPEGGYLRADHAFVDEHFSAVYGLRLLEGRFFSERDDADAPRVAVIDRELAARLWPGQSALGRRLHLDPASESGPRAEVVGVVDSLHLRRLDQQARPSLLLPLRQNPVRFATVALRLDEPAAGYASALQRQVQAVDADTPAYWVRTQAEAIRLGRVPILLLTQIFTAVGLLALLLAAAGLYGVLAFSVAQRTRELGIRRAVGAGVGDVVSVVGRRVAVQVLAGLAIGLLLAWPWSAVLATPGLQTRAGDPLIFAATALIVVTVACVAALDPLRRALRVHPLEALRRQ